MRLLFVVQRYGTEVAGGAERACRAFAEQLATRGHDIEVVTSCAVSYVDWANHYPPGTTSLNGVQIHRLTVGPPREDRLFGPLNARVVHALPPVPLHMQKVWLQQQGPFVPGLEAWLWQHATDYDAVVFFTYLYWPTWAGLRTTAGRVPTVLFPFAHDEPYLRLSIFESVFRLPDALGYLTEEEQALVASRFGQRTSNGVTGLGIDLAPLRTDPSEVRARYGLGDRPYLLALGRVDPAKGLNELFSFFTAYKRRTPGPLALLVMGEPIRPLPEHPDVIPTGWVDEPTKHGALAGATALVHPSYYESFSIVLAESWVQNRPALVQGQCAVLAGQARRSGGAIPYIDFAEFEAAVDLVLAEPRLAAAMGRRGHQYVAERYDWDKVANRFLRLLRSAKPRSKVSA